MDGSNVSHRPSSHVVHRHVTNSRPAFSTNRHNDSSPACSDDVVRYFSILRCNNALAFKNIWQTEQYREPNPIKKLRTAHNNDSSPASVDDVVKLFCCSVIMHLPSSILFLGSFSNRTENQISSPNRTESKKLPNARPCVSFFLVYPPGILMRALTAYTAEPRTARHARVVRRETADGAEMSRR